METCEEILDKHGVKIEGAHRTSIINAIKEIVGVALGEGIEIAKGCYCDGEYDYHSETQLKEQSMIELFTDKKDETIDPHSKPPIMGDVVLSATRSNSISISKIEN